jgi:ADP-ribose pyrophosphatase YjhB (NUDIX family)
MAADSLYRISLKCIIKNEAGEILVVKEIGRNVWDLPGGGIEHGETIRQGIARELKEEIDLDGDFTYKVLCIIEPEKLRTRDLWQVKLLFEVMPAQKSFRPGLEADEIAFKNPGSFKDSDNIFEREIYTQTRVDL